MYQNIMIPVSFDDDRDVDSAIEVARQLSSPGARVTFFHVIEHLPTYVADQIPTDVWQNRHAQARKRVADFADTVDGAQGIVMDGPPGRTITGWASDHGADLIVIASHRPQISDIFLGSTAAWVVRHADCAVHVIR